MIFGFGKISPTVVRPLRADKAQECAAIHASGFAYPWSPAEIAAMIGGPNNVGAAALDPASGELRGFVISRVAADEAEILTIAVRKAMRGKGIAGQLLQHHVARLAEGGVRALFLEVDDANAPALALYRRHGFAPVGERPGYFRARDAAPGNALIMRKPLAPQ